MTKGYEKQSARSAENVSESRQIIEIKFWVPGVPAPGGSKDAFRHPKTGKIVVVDACARNKPWRERVAAFAMDHRPDKLITEAIAIKVDFFMNRPKSHFGTGKNKNKLKPSAPMHCTKRPDTTKLFRALEDALTGIIWKDDEQVVRQIVQKHYAHNPGAFVHIKTMEG